MVGKRGIGKRTGEATVAAVGGNVLEGTSAINIGDITTIIQAALEPLVNKMQELERQLGRPATVAVVEEENCAPKSVLQVVEMLPQRERPTFSGGNENPISFLEDIKEYTRKVKRTDPLVVVRENLKGEAKSWAKLYNKRWETMLDFEKDFLATYWGDIKKNEVRRRLAEGIYDNKKNISMLTHFASYWELAKALKITDTSLGVVDEIMRHYPKEIQSLWFSGPTGDEIIAAEFLRKLDTLVCTPEERITKRKSGEDTVRKDKYRDRYHAIKRRIHAIESVDMSAECSKCTKTDNTSKKNSTVTASGKELVIAGNSGNDRGLVQ